MNTVAIIGCGNVGSTVANNLYQKDICDLMLLNHNKVRAESNMFDISDSPVEFNHHKIICADYSDIRDAKIVINCAGNSNLLRSKNRNSEFENSKRIADDIISNLNKYGFRGIFINVMNPCDEITYLFTGLDISKNNILGTGTSLETIRLRRIIYEEFNVYTESYIIGIHGTKNIIIPKDILLQKDLDSLLNQVQNRVWDIYSGKGYTNFGIANSVYSIVQSILLNLNNEICVSVILDTFSSDNRCSISVPCIINSEGVADIKLYDEVKLGLNKLFKGDE